MGIKSYRSFTSAIDQGKKKGVQGIVNSFLHGAGNPTDSTYSAILANSGSLHELSVHNVKPEAMDDYKQVIKIGYEKISLSPEFPCKLFGSFVTEVGELDQAVHFWEYSSYQEYEETKRLIANNKDFIALMKKVKPMLRNRSNEIILNFNFWKLAVPTDTKLIYELRSYRLKPGRMLEWQSGWEKGLKARKKFVTPVGAWFSQLGQLHNVHHMWAYDSLHSRKEMREMTWQDKGWSNSVQITTPLIDEMQSRILKPLLLAKAVISRG